MTVFDDLTVLERETCKSEKIMTVIITGYVTVLPKCLRFTVFETFQTFLKNTAKMGLRVVYAMSVFRLREYSNGCL